MQQNHKYKRMYGSFQRGDVVQVNPAVSGCHIAVIDRINEYDERTHSDTCFVIFAKRKPTDTQRQTALLAGHILTLIRRKGQNKHMFEGQFGTDAPAPNLEDDAPELDDAATVGEVETVTTATPVTDPDELEALAALDAETEEYMAAQQAQRAAQAVETAAAAKAAGKALKSTADKAAKEAAKLKAKEEREAAKSAAKAEKEKAKAERAQATAAKGSTKTPTFVLPDGTQNLDRFGSGTPVRVGTFFVPGNDAKLKSLLTKVGKGLAKLEDVPAISIKFVNEENARWYNEFGFGKITDPNHTSPFYSPEA